MPNRDSLNFNGKTGRQKTRFARTFYFFFGYLGIGTTAPIEKLQVNGSMAVTGAATTLLASSARISEEAGSNASFISMGPNGSARGQMSLSIANSDFTGYLTPFRIYDTGVISMNVGNVGIVATYLKYKTRFYVFFY